MQAARAETQQPLTNDGSAVSVPAIGIDLGTSYTRVGVMERDKFEIITNDQGKPLPTSLRDQRLTSVSCRQPYHSFLGCFHR